MATKKISDLQLRSDFAATCNLPTDDTSQTWRVTGAQMSTFFKAAIAPIAALGDLLYGAAAGAPTALAGNITLVKKVLTQTGTGSVSAAPAWLAPTLPYLAYAAKVTTYVAALTDEFISVDGSGGAWALTLPAASTATGKIYFIRRIETTLANAVTVTGNASELIDGANTFPLYTIGETLVIICDGTGWHVLDHKTNVIETTYTPTLVAGGTTSTNTAKWWRAGGRLFVDGSIVFTGAGSAARLTIALPTGITMDTSRMSAATTNGIGSTLGVLRWFDNGTNHKCGTVHYDSTSTVVLINDAGTDTILGSAFANGDHVNYQFSIAATNWKH